MLWWKFAKILKSFSKPQGSFCSNFTLLFSVMKDNSSVIFYVKDYIIGTKGTNQTAHFGDFWVPGSIFTKFFSIFKHQIRFCSNIAPIFTIMRHNSCVLFLAEIVYTLNKRSLPKYKFGEMHLSSWNFSEILHFDGSFCKNHIKFQSKKYRVVISHDIEDWCKI